MRNTTDLLASYRATPSDEAFALLHEQFKFSIRQAIVGQISPDLLRRIQITQVVDTALRKGIPAIAFETDIDNGWDAVKFLRYRAKMEAISEVRKHLAGMRSISREVDNLDVAAALVDNRAENNISEFNELTQIIGDEISRLGDAESRLIGQLSVIEGLSGASVQLAIVDAGFKSIPLGTIAYREKKIRERIKNALIAAGYSEPQ